MRKAYATYKCYATDEEIREFIEENKEANDWEVDVDSISDEEKAYFSGIIGESNWTLFLYDLGCIIKPYLNAKNPNMIIEGSSLDWMNQSGSKKINLQHLFRNLDVDSPLIEERIGLDFLRELTTNESTIIEVKINEKDWNEAGESIIDFSIRFAQHDSNPYFECFQFTRNNKEFIEEILEHLNDSHYRSDLDFSLVNESILIKHNTHNQELKVSFVFPSNNKPIIIHLLKENDEQLETFEDLYLLDDTTELEEVVCSILDNVKNYYYECDEC